MTSFITKAYCLHEARVLLPRIILLASLSMMAVQLLVVVLAGSFLLSPSRGEVFTALVHMEGLLSLEKDLLEGLNSYIAQERRR